MLDELAMETLQEKSQHKEELGAVRLRHEKEVLGVRARYERELRELHEDKKRQEEELRGQIREEKVGGWMARSFCVSKLREHSIADGFGGDKGPPSSAHLALRVSPLPGPNSRTGESPADRGRTSSSGTFYGWSQGLV